MNMLRILGKSWINCRLLPLYPKQIHDLVTGGNLFTGDEMTREIQLTQGKVAIVDDEDFEWLNQWKWYAHRYDKIWYAERNKPRPYVEKKTIRMHAVILGNDKWADHKNGNGLDNRRDNLRECTYSQNVMNRGIQSNNTSGYIGVAWHKKIDAWVAYIQVNRKRINLGRFTTKEEAAYVRDQAAIKYHGEFSHLNFLNEQAYTAALASARGTETGGA